MEATFWVLGGYGAVLMAIGGVVFRQTSQIAVLQKTVDHMVAKMDLFLKTEIDTLKELIKESK
jgi:hypothetical protein